VFIIVVSKKEWLSSWLRLYGSWVYNYLCNQCLSPLTLWVRIPLRRGVLDTTLCDKVCQCLALAAGQWFSPGTLVSSTNKTDRHDITVILLKVTLNTITLTLYISYQGYATTSYSIQLSEILSQIGLTNKIYSRNNLEK